MPDSVRRAYTWRRIFERVLAHKKALVKAHVIALFAMLATVPLPLLLPLMIDEVLLEQPGMIVAQLDAWMPVDWQGTMGYIEIGRAHV